MDKKSLEEVRENIVLLLDKLDNIAKEDRMELLINLYHFLDPNKYESNIKTLRKKP